MYLEQLEGCCACGVLFELHDRVREFFKTNKDNEDDNW